MSFGSWWDKNVKKTVNKIGNTISDTVRSGTDALGLTTPSIPDEAKLQIDPTKAASLAGYQNTANQNVSRWGENTPGGSGYFTPEQYTATLPEKQTTPTSVRETDLTYTPQTNNVPTEQQSTDMSALKALSKPNYGQTSDNISLRLQNVGDQNIKAEAEPTDIKLGRSGSVNAPQNIAKSDAESRQLNTNFSQALPERTSEASIAAPTLQSEGQTNLGLGRVSQFAPDTQKYSSAADTALQERLNTQADTTQGYDPQQEALAVQQMTAGLDAQQQEAEAAMKEQFKKNGMLGSSVASAELAKLKAKYDEQKSTAVGKVKLQNLEAQREDRYKNQSQASDRLNQIAALSSSGQGLATQSATTKAGLTAQDNSATTQEANFLQNQRSIDNSNAMKLAEYNRAGRTTDEAANLNRAGFNQGSQQLSNAAIAQNAQTATSSRQADEQLAMQKANFAREGITADNSATMQEAQFGQQGRATNLANQVTLENLNRQGIAQNNANATTEAGFNVQQGNTAYERQKAASDTEYARTMGTESYGREGRQIDTATAQNLATTNFNQNMQNEEFNRQGRATNTAQDWQTYNANNEDALNRANTLNQQSQYNLNRGDTAKQQEYQSYQNDLNRQEGATSGTPYTASSVASADEYAQKQNLQQQRLGNTIGLATTLASPVLGTAAATAKKKTTTANANKIIPSVR
ncbi:MAG: hypothetical protein PHQ91_12310 [Thermoanaerobaculaceae bacterium]|nr:hypothetical protein [Thermoanaerobaculaceae bacterium]